MTKKHEDEKQTKLEAQSENDAKMRGDLDVQPEETRAQSKQAQAEEKVRMQQLKDNEPKDAKTELARLGVSLQELKSALGLIPGNQRVNDALIHIEEQINRVGVVI